MPAVTRSRAGTARAAIARAVANPMARPMRKGELEAFAEGFGEDDLIGCIWQGRRQQLRKLFDEFIEVHELVARSDASQERRDQLLDTIRRIAALPFGIDMDE